MSQRAHLGLGISLVLLAGLCLSHGSTGWSTWGFSLNDSSLNDINAQIFALRAQRVATAALAGASLGVAGGLMQTLLHNELADPYVLGMSGGAALGAVTSALYFPTLHPGVFAAMSAWASAWVVEYWTDNHSSTATTVVYGFLFGSVLAAMTGLLLFMAPENAGQRTAQNWLFGGLRSAHVLELSLMLAMLLIAIIWVAKQHVALDRLLCGHDSAVTLGVNVASLSRQIQRIAAGLTAVAVVAGGLIGCVGWAAPHLARTFVGAAHRDFIKVSALLGAALLMVADLLARTLAAPRELPVGLLTALLIAPLLYFWRRKEFVW